MAKEGGLDFVPANVNNYPRIGDSPEKQKLRKSIAALDRGEISLDELKKVQDEVTREVILEQVEAGIKLVTDGQIRWDDAQTYIARALRGVRITGLVRYFDTNTYFRQPLVEGEIAWERPILVDDYKYAASVSPVPVKAVVTGPYTLARLSLDEYYKDPIKLTQAYGAAIKKELQALYEAGAKVVQVDEPALVRYPDLADQALSVLADVLQVERGSGTELGLLVFWGSLGDRLSAVLDLPIDFLGVDLVAGLDDRALLEKGADLKGKKLALGLIDGRNTKLEKASEVANYARRLAEANKLETGYVQPNCGLELLPRDVAKTKLEIVAETCR
ncbi:MAG: methylcobamide--CoM methyltransferase, partial [Calditrichaeota bacterium]|nr:methylcobamide--CoM methyltransferase [Calditrichota bacterium]